MKPMNAPDENLLDQTAAGTHAGKGAAARRLRLAVRGAVQGVGFRPFVYRLATELGLSGWVNNDARGVTIEAEGDPAALEAFTARLQRELPPLAAIHALERAWIAPEGVIGFAIRASDGGGPIAALLLPDAATCPECLAEVRDPADRRHLYPFTNCTNCGPRFTIIRNLPYDRAATTMAGFAMCPACQREYDAPGDRRFHAQPNACPVCGPHLTLHRRQGDVWITCGERDDALRSAAAALRAGEVVAVKGLGGFHLMCDAAQDAPIARLRQLKSRAHKPLALMARDLDQVCALAAVDDASAALLASPAAPIAILPRRAGAPLSPLIAPGNPTVGIMLPATPLHHLLLGELDGPVVATSGNLADEPICTDNDEAFARLGALADAFLVHDRPIQRHVDDSVARVVEGTPALLRRARGYAPAPLRVTRELPCILAVGAHLKNTVALSTGTQVHLSQHIGDLETPEALDAFERVIGDFLTVYGARPVAIAHDLHPDYAATRWAQEAAAGSAGLARLAGLPLVAVQHHHAHLAACLLEHGLEQVAGGPALGVTWDGTGYGTDGTIWGGEFLAGDAAAFTRAAHLRPFRLPGGEAAIRRPWQIAAALLHEAFGPEGCDPLDFPGLRAVREGDLRLVQQMIGKGVNAPLTTSAGRLFDGIAALLGLVGECTFEGQAAMALEWCAEEMDGEGGAPYALALRNAQDGPRVVDWMPLLGALRDDLRRGVAAPVIAGRVHGALAEAIAAVAADLGIERVVLTGGCFQNARLTSLTARRLEAGGFAVLRHRQLPPNDGSISAGQIAVTATKTPVRG
jgi:hydrogenase maturation protein HypF